MPNLEDEFRRAMLSTYDQAKDKGYNPTYFMRMLDQYGAVDAAKRLLQKQEIQEGLMKLCELGLLDTSMEAFVIQDRFKPLFTEAEIIEARRRLDKLDYFKPKKK